MSQPTAPPAGSPTAKLGAWSRALPPPSFDTLVAYADGALTPAKRTAVEASLAAHPELYAVVRDLRSPDPALLAAADAAIAAAIAPVGGANAFPDRPPATARPSPRRWLRAALVIGASAAAALALVLGPLSTPGDGPHRARTFSVDLGDSLRSGTTPGDVTIMYPGEKVTLRPAPLSPPACRQVFEFHRRQVRALPGAAQCQGPSSFPVEGGSGARFLVLVDAPGTQEVDALGPALAAEALKGEPLPAVGEEERQRRVFAVLRETGEGVLDGASVEISPPYEVRSR